MRASRQGPPGRRRFRRYRITPAVRKADGAAPWSVAVVTMNRNAGALAATTSTNAGWVNAATAPQFSAK